MSLEIMCKVSENDLVSGEDWDVLLWHNDKLFTAGYANGKVKVWSEDLRPLNEFVAHDYSIYHMTAGSSTTFYTSSSDSTIKHWDETKEGEFVLLETLEGHEEPARKIRFDGKRLYSGDELGKVKIWEDGKLLVTLETLEEIWDMVVFNDYLVTCRHVDIIINMVTQREDKIRHSVKNTFAGKGPLLVHGDKLCFGDRNNFDIHVSQPFQTGNPSVGKLQGHEALVNAMKSLGSTLYTGGGDNKVIAWDLESFKPISEVSLSGYVNDIAINSRSGTVYAAGQNKFLVAIRGVP